MGGEVLGRLDVFNDVLIQPFVPDRAVVALDAGVLLGLSGLDMLDGNPLPRRPFHQFDADVFRAIVDTNDAWFAAPFDDAFEAANDPLGGQREVDLDA